MKKTTIPVLKRFRNTAERLFRLSFAKIGVKEPEAIHRPSDQIKKNPILKDVVFISITVRMGQLL